MWLNPAMYMYIYIYNVILYVVRYCYTYTYIYKYKHIHNSYNVIYPSIQGMLFQLGELIKVVFMKVIPGHPHDPSRPASHADPSDSTSGSSCGTNPWRFDNALDDLGRHQRSTRVVL